MAEPAELVEERLPLRIFRRGEDRLEYVVEATSDTRGCSWTVVGLSGPGAVWALVHVLRVEHPGAAPYLLPLLSALALVMAGLATYRRRVLVDRGWGEARLRVSVFGVPVRSSSRAGPGGRLGPAGVRSWTRTHRTRTRGTYVTHTTPYYRAVFRPDGRSVWNLGPTRGDEETARGDVGPLEAFLTAPVEPTPTRAAWTEPAPFADASALCPFCREALAGGGPVVSCRGCRTGYHGPCAEELGGCATLGCGHRQAGRARA